MVAVVARSSRTAAWLVLLRRGGGGLLLAPLGRTATTSHPMMVNDDTS